MESETENYDSMFYLFTVRNNHLIVLLDKLENWSFSHIHFSTEMAQA